MLLYRGAEKKSEERQRNNSWTTDMVSSACGWKCSEFAAPTQQKNYYANFFFLIKNWISPGVLKGKRGAPRNRYKDQLKRQFAQAGISHQSWQHEASDRDSWRSPLRKASCEFEAERHEAAKEKRRRQKKLAASQSSSFQTFVCPKCSRGCASRIGLHSHQRVCKNWPSTFPTILVCE